MGAFRSVAVVAATAAMFAVGTGAAVWAQTEWKAPADAKKTKNPEKATDLGKKSVETNCAACHGPKGKGDGPAAAALNPKPGNWTSDKVKKETDGELFWKITNGRGAMPPWKHLPEKERWQIVNYIRQLQKGG
ncbi:MAG: cytochrome c [Candidatus Rokubacteria bacterium]|nr:cytochrome c [Candidatus Rokubacteria bacterium]